MPQGFIIMQIGQPDLDLMCEKVILPAMASAGIDPRRVDKHNQGGLLKSEIIRFLQQAELIVADLTNERPNCYLEVGYAMGLDKFRNLILTARRDHNIDAPDHRPGGPKVHFDLAGYDILFWDPNNLEFAREELTRRIRRRLSVIGSPSVTASPWDNEWIEEQRAVAMPNLQSLGYKGGMEIRHSPADRQLNFTHGQLLDAARNAQIHTFGWPIGIVIETNEFQPQPRTEGVFEEIAIRDHSLLARRKTSYDYWALRRDGDYCLLKSFFEDEFSASADVPQLFFNTRIVRVTEALLHCARLYDTLKLDPASTIHIAIRHTGLKGRRLGTSNPARQLSTFPICAEEESETTVAPRLLEIQTDLIPLVKTIVQPLLILFGFFELGDPVYEEIVNSYVQGRTT